MRPFILRGAIALPPTAKPPIEHVYDPVLQLWLDNRTGTPVVAAEAATAATRYGETVFTATREGADQTESASVHAPMAHRPARARASETALGPEAQSTMQTRFGETLMTETGESADMSETASVPTHDCHAAHSHF